MKEMYASITCGCLRFIYSFTSKKEKLETMVKISKDEQFILTRKVFVKKNSNFLKNVRKI